MRFEMPDQVGHDGKELVPLVTVSVLTLVVASHFLASCLEIPEPDDNKCCNFMHWKD